MTRALPSPGLSWLPHRTAFSERFGDVYRSRDGGLAETRHVFLDGCSLPLAWRESSLFVIGELGFGTGLNFLAAYDLWRRTKRQDARLHYIAVEGFPLSHSELRECVERWPELKSAGQALLRVYLQPQAGFQRLFLDGGKVMLTLLFGEAHEMLAQLEAQIDAWFLDGFSPDKNPEIWRPDVLNEVARLSKPGTRLATYSTAGEVRRNLSAAGFDVLKTPGFGQKNEMLRATFRGAETVTQHLPPWFARAPVGHALNSPSRGGHALIVGAGLAGAYTAHALHRRGWKATVVERGPEIAAEASGNSSAVLMPRLTAAANLDGRFYASAWRLALDVLEELADAGCPLSRDRCGVLQLATDAGDEERIAAIADTGALEEPYLFHLGAKEASEIAGVTLPYRALFFPQGGWLDPRLLVRALTRQARVVLNTTVGRVQRSGGLWEALDAQGQTIAMADVVIFANAMMTLQAPELSWLPLAARRGQISFVAASKDSANLRCVLGYGGTITPAHHGLHCLGATFDWTDNAFAVQTVNEDDHGRNFADLAAALPTLARTLPEDATLGRAAIRCTTPDHLPVAGPAPDQTAYLRDFAELRHGHPWARYAEASYHPGLYVLAGLGSRGLVAGAMGAELLACQITAEPWPLERDIATALHPGRFLVRDLKRLKV